MSSSFPPFLTQGLQQLLMEEQNLVNRKDFIHGYTALHWAAKHGRCDIIAGLMLNGAQVDIKSVRTVRVIDTRYWFQQIFSLSLTHTHPSLILDTYY